MSKYIGIQRIHRAILNLPLWRAKVDAQGAMHLWTFLSIKRRSVTTGAMTRFGELDDKSFFDDFMRVQDTEYPYYDPLVGETRIRSHYHSNVATARKNTFSNRWRAATFETRQEVEDGAKKSVEYWQFSDNYLDVIKDHVLTKDRLVTQVPLFDLLAWIYRTREFSDDITLDRLVQLFREEFHITGTEFTTLFTTDAMDGITESASKFFADHPPPAELVLSAAMQKGNFDLSEALAALPQERKAQPVELDDILTLLRNGRGQLIIQGPPGTGKTFLARQLAALLLGAERSLLADPAAFSAFMKQRQFSTLAGNEDAAGSIARGGGRGISCSSTPATTTRISSGASPRQPRTGRASPPSGPRIASSV